MVRNIRRCDALACPNNNKNCNLPFFTIPEGEKRLKWLENIELCKTDRKRKFLCSDHFEMGAFTSTLRLRLVWDAVPTIQSKYQPFRKPVKNSCLETTGTYKTRFGARLCQSSENHDELSIKPEPLDFEENETELVISEVDVPDFPVDPKVEDAVDEKAEFLNLPEKNVVMKQASATSSFEKLEETSPPKDINSAATEIIVAEVVGPHIRRSPRQIERIKKAKAAELETSNSSPVHRPDGTGPTICYLHQVESQPTIQQLQRPKVVQPIRAKSYIHNSANGVERTLKLSDKNVSSEQSVNVSPISSAQEINDKDSSKRVVMDISRGHNARNTLSVSNSKPQTGNTLIVVSSTNISHRNASLQVSIPSSGTKLCRPPNLASKEQIQVVKMYDSSYKVPLIGSTVKKIVNFSKGSSVKVENNSTGKRIHFYNARPHTDKFKKRLPHTAIVHPAVYNETATQWKGPIRADYSRSQRISTSKILDSTPKLGKIVSSAKPVPPCLVKVEPVNTEEAHYQSADATVTSTQEEDEATNSSNTMGFSHSSGESCSKKIKVDDNSESMHQGNSYLSKYQDDPDFNFLLSLLPFFKKMSLPDRLKARMQMQEVIYEIGQFSDQS